MLSQYSRLRYLAPIQWDRVLKLVQTRAFDTSRWESNFKLVNISRDKKKFSEVLTTIEGKILASGYFNFSIDNVPSRGILSDTDRETKIGYSHMRETMGQFGRVEDIILCQGKAYVKFKTREDATTTHGLINGMQMGNKIISTRVF